FLIYKKVQNRKTDSPAHQKHQKQKHASRTKNKKKVDFTCCATFQPKGSTVMTSPIRCTISQMDGSLRIFDIQSFKAKDHQPVQ
ncbi:hypothetical protein QN401_28725, partial [Pseudomonas sp. 5S3]